VRTPRPSEPEPRIQAALRLRRGDFDFAVDLDLPGRGVTALFGPSGSGKTTCLRAVAGLDRAAGAVRVLGQVWQDDARGVFVPVHRRGCGFVFQDTALLPHLSVRENLDYARRRARLPQRLDPGLVLTTAGLDALLDRRPSQLSGGERKRAAIAQALLAEPTVLLLDEPLAGIDRARKGEIVSFVERLCDELPFPIVLVTHAADEIERLASHVVLLERGRVIATGAPGEVFSGKG